MQKTVQHEEMRMHLPWLPEERDMLRVHTASCLEEPASCMLLPEGS